MRKKIFLCVGGTVMGVKRHCLPSSTHGGNLPGWLPIAANTLLVSLPVSTVIPQGLTMAFLVNIGPNAAIHSWIPTSLADLSFIQRAANESGPNLPPFKQVLGNEQCTCIFIRLYMYYNSKLTFWLRNWL